MTSYWKKAPALGAKWEQGMEMSLVGCSASIGAKLTAKEVLGSNGARQNYSRTGEARWATSTRTQQWRAFAKR
jgi:hypothetical protein